MGSSLIRSELFRSQVLQGNALGDPSERLVHVVLPAEYADGDERFPVVFLLAGFTGTGASFLRYEAWEEDILQRMDRLVASGLVRPMILILPDAMTRFGGSQYINSAATGRYQDYLLELVDWAVHSLRTLRAPHRARPHDQAFRDVMELAAMSSCYSPHPDSPFGFDFPIDLATGAVRPEVWERWREHDPLVRLVSAVEPLRRVRLLYLVCR